MTQFFYSGSLINTPSFPNLQFAHLQHESFNPAGKIEILKTKSQLQNTHTHIDTDTMKILESQSAILTNFEVYQHLLNEQQKARLPERKRQVPRNVQTVIREVRPAITAKC